MLQIFTKNNGVQLLANKSFIQEQQFSVNSNSSQSQFSVSQSDFKIRKNSFKYVQPIQVKYLEGNIKYPMNNIL